MKRTLLFLATGLFIAVSAAGGALAADTPSGQLSPKASQAPGPQDSSSARQQPHRTEIELPAEAPWISLALANAQAIGLSAEQQRTLETLRNEYEQRSAHHRELIDKAEMALQQKLAAPLVDLNQVRASLNEIGALTASMRLSRIETLLKGKAAMSPEQLTKLETVVAKSHESMMQRTHRSDRPAQETK